MGKIFGINGKVTGKVGGVVYANRQGVTVVREYNPSISNPSTASQVAARAKLKLMSQLSAVMAPYIAIKRDGAVTGRNQFVRANYKLATYANSQADISLVDVTLTKSVVAFPEISVVRQEEPQAIVALIPNSAGLSVSRVVYVGFVKQADGTLRALGSAVVTDPGAASRWAGELPYTTGEVVVYAYGVRDNTELAKAVYGEMQTLTAESVAKVITTRSLSDVDVTLTETVAMSIQAMQ